MCGGEDGGEPSDGGEWEVDRKRRAVEIVFVGEFGNKVVGVRWSTITQGERKEGSEGGECTPKGRV